MSKTVVVTGAFGRVGSRTVSHLLRAGHRVIAVDIKNPRSEGAAAVLDKRVEVVWGNICDRDLWPELLPRTDAVVHLAAIIPPVVDQQPDLAIAVNQTATCQLVDAMEASDSAKRLIFASSMVVSGHEQHERTPPLRANEPTNPTDLYSKTKVAGEERIQKSTLRWSILRLAVVVPGELKLNDTTHMDAMFDASPDGRFEAVHEDDAGLAFANAVDCEEATGHILYIGGGGSCQTTVLDFYNRMLGAIGLGPMKVSSLRPGEPYFYGDWLDTEESQKLLQFQRHSIDDIITSMRRSVGPLRYLLTLASPLITWKLERRSPHRRAKA